MRTLIAAGLLLAALCARAAPFSFGLFGDMPYGHWEREQLPAMLDAMGQEPLAFVIHDGDIKNGVSKCSDETYRDILGVFQASPHPLVFVPGDNEWTDCHRFTCGGYDPQERLSRLRELFFAGGESLGRRRIALRRQSDDGEFPAVRENAAWDAGGIGFVTLNVTGSKNGIVDAGNPSAEFITRGRANRAWLAAAFARARAARQAGLVIVIQANPDFEAAAAGEPRAGYRDFIAQLRGEARSFAGQVLLVHGDTHTHRIDHPLAAADGTPLPNVTRLETYGSPFIGWVKVTADAASPRVFRFDPRPWRPVQ